MFEVRKRERNKERASEGEWWYVNGFEWAIVWRNRRKERESKRWESKKRFTPPISVISTASLIRNKPNNCGHTDLMIWFRALKGVFSLSRQNSRKKSFISSDTATFDFWLFRTDTWIAWINTVKSQRTSREHGFQRRLTRPILRTVHTWYVCKRELEGVIDQISVYIRGWVMEVMK